MQVLDLFSGIGGFSLGLERAGPFRTVAFCEREPFCQAVLKKHWPSIPIYDDVRTIPTDRLGRIDLVCGGFPCQPWSVAGQQRGAEDDRDLWPIMASLVENLRPKWVIGENVRGFINEPLGLERSLSDLESIGYQATPFVIPACAVDAKHRRDRVWIVAYSKSNSQSDVTINEGTRSRELVGDANSQQRKSTKKDRGMDVDRDILDRRQGQKEADTTNRSGGDVADANSIRSSGRAKKQIQRISKESWQSIRRGEREPRRWTTEPAVGRVVNGFPGRVDRLKALGNAVVPQVVEQIGKAIIKAETCAQDTNGQPT